MHLATYCDNKAFRFHVDRCLELNHIQPSWIGLAQLEPLLFCRLDEETEEWRSGYLVELNQPKKAITPSNGKPVSLEELIAAIALNLGSMIEALELARTEPTQFLTNLLEQKTRLQTPPEERRKRDLAEWASRERAKARGQG